MPDTGTVMGADTLGQIRRLCQALAEADMGWARQTWGLGTWALPEPVTGA